jgi:hypothetical protein
VLGFEAGWYRVMTTQTGVRPQDGPVTLDQLRATLTEIAGTDFGLHAPRWLSRYGDTARQADRYRQGRVLLAGDAAHIHYPAGGQGLNTGVQDAVNLGWKLAAVLRGDAAETLLDTYHEERHPVGARVLDNTRAQVALGRYDAQTEALRATVAGMIAQPAVNDQLAGMVTALDVAYPLGGGHPLVGRRLPDVDLPDGRRSYQLLHPARPVLLDLGATPLAVPARSTTCAPAAPRRRGGCRCSARYRHRPRRWSARTATSPGRAAPRATPPVWTPPWRPGCTSRQSRRMPDAHPGPRDRRGPGRLRRAGSLEDPLGCGAGSRG